MKVNEQHGATAGVHPAARWSQGAHSCFLVLQATRAWWRYCQASPMRGAQRFAAFAWRAGTSPQLHLDWLHVLDRDADMRLAAASDPSLLERWQRPFAARSLTDIQRLRLLDEHFAFVTRHFPPRLREKVLKGHDLRLATLPLRDGDVAYLHVRKSMEAATGELGLVLLDAGKQVLASCALTLHRQGALIGDMRGSWRHLGKDAVRRFTRESHGTRPKDLLLSVVRALGRHYGWTSLRAVAAAGSVSPSDRDAHAHDAFWRAHGGELRSDGCFDLSCTPAQRAIGTWPSRRRAARHRKLRFREDVCRLVLRSFDGPFHALSSPVAWHPARGEAAAVPAPASEAWWPMAVRSR